MDSLKISSQVENLESLTFETAMIKLEAIVNRLERGECPLDEAIETFEQGMKLKKLCEEKLQNAQLKIEKIMANGSNGVINEPNLRPVLSSNS